MKLHIVSRFEQADKITAGMDAAKTVAEAETWDAAWFRLPESLRAAFLEREAAEADPDDFLTTFRLPDDPADTGPDLHLVDPDRPGGDP